MTSYPVYCSTKKQVEILASSCPFAIGQYLISADGIISRVRDVKTFKEMFHVYSTILGDIEGGRLKGIDYVTPSGTQIRAASLEDVACLIPHSASSMNIGTLHGTNISMEIDLSKIATNHLYVLAQTGMGKSHTMKHIIRGLQKAGIALVIFDVEGEYNNIPGARHFTLCSDNPGTLMKLHPRTVHDFRWLAEGKFTDSETKEVSRVLSYFSSFDSEQDYNLFLNTLEFTGLANRIATNLMQDCFIHKEARYIYPDDLIKPGQISIINLMGIDATMKKYVGCWGASKILEYLFNSRLAGDISGFVWLAEEAHQLTPQRYKTALSDVAGVIMMRGRKWEVGGMVVSQRPANVNKDILSQCGSQILLGMKSPQDIKAASSTTEGVGKAVFEELPSLQQGQAIIAGLISPTPLRVNIKA